MCVCRCVVVRFYDDRLYDVNVCTCMHEHRQERANAWGPAGPLLRTGCECEVNLLIHVCDQNH